MAEVSGVQHQTRRATSAQLSTFVGSTGEVLVDNTFFRRTISDALTGGGWYGSKANYTGVTAAYTVLPTDAFVGVDSQNAVSLTLPLSALYPVGQKLSIADISGNSSVANITINTATSTEKLLGISIAGSLVNSTTLTIVNGSFGFQLTPLSTTGQWAFWF